VGGSWPVYSIRFLYGIDKDVMHIFTVPDGYRAVVKEVVVMNRGTAGGYVQVQLHTVLVVNYTFLDTYRTVTVSTGQVVYERETLRYYAGGQAAEVMVSGFLLRDDGSGPRASDYTTERALEVAEQLPR
jgi:hypothetical protein